MSDAASERSKSEKQLAKYEAWIREVEKRQAELAKHRTAYIRFFCALPIVSFLGFLRDVRTGGAALFTGILMAAFGVYAVLVREGDYELNLKNTRKTAAELRRACGAPDA